MSCDWYEVEFYGGPHDGLRLVEGVTQFTDNPDMCYEVNRDGHVYRPNRTDNGVLILAYRGVRKQS